MKPKLRSLPALLAALLIPCCASHDEPAPAELDSDGRPQMAPMGPLFMPMR